MRERWEHCLGEKTGSLTENYLQKVFPTNAGEENIFINGGVFGNNALIESINRLTPGQVLVKGEIVIAARPTEKGLDITQFHEHIKGLSTQHFEGDIQELQNVWNIFSQNGKAISYDYELITSGRQSAPIPENVYVTGSDKLFIEPGAVILPGCIINAATGPVYIGRDTEVMEGSMLRGPIALCEHSVVKMGAKIYGASTIGVGCKVGGEINNVVFFANSNKAHDGFLGNSVIGEWCNLGADTNCSNLKNNYDGVQVWHEASGKSVSTGLTFCGLMMGDHSKCAINTMFNTGTVVAVSCNIFGAGFPGKFIPSFSWGGSDKIIAYNFEKSIETANRMMDRRGKKLSDDEVEMYRYIFENWGKGAKKKEA
jgi:UDP-N-acetylglucosamine diphosphorylase/glucosamine-1-phosphate N-acetyltransferase